VKAPSLAIFLTALVLCAGPAHAQDPDGGVELHAHLFMKEGLGWLFSGSFVEPLEAVSWDDQLSSNVNAEALEASGARVVVVALFAHPMFVGDPREAVRAQIAQAEAWVREHRNWALVRDPRQAERRLREGKRLMVLSLEGASGVLESEEDLREFVDELGIRIVAPLHLVDDRVGGPALLGGEQAIGNPLGLVDQLLDPHDRQGVSKNRRGLTSFGKRLLRELLRRGVWIDLSHTSDRALADMLPMLRAADQPPLVSHTTLRRHLPAERATSDALLREVRDRRGIVGLMPSAPLLGRIATRCPETCDSCRGANAFATLYREVARVIGPEAVMLGSDWNGSVRHLPPSCGTGTSLDGTAGFYHMGQERELWRALRKLGAPVPPLHQTVDRFIETWSRVRSVTLDDTGLVALPSRDDVVGPSLDLALGAGIGSTGLRMPGVALFGAMQVRKDVAGDIGAEPYVYFAAVDANATIALEEPDLAYLEVRAAPVGIAAELIDNRARAEALPIQVARRVPLDQAILLQSSVARALVRTMPGVLKDPGCFNFYIELELDLLGYKHIEYLSERSTLDALHFTGVGAALGMRSTFQREVYALFEAHLFGDANLALPDAVVQSDYTVGGRFALGFVEQGVELFAQSNWLGSRDERDPALALSAWRHLGGVVVTIR
jgi:microsomal dipeptidase-like Zn-dependent dipeptidase